MSSNPRRKPVDVDAAELLPLDDAAEKITAFFASLGDESPVAVSVYGIDPKNRLRGRSFLFTLPTVGELTGPELMAQVLERYGAGEYLAEGRVDGKIAFTSRFLVGPVKGGRVEIPPPAAPAPTSATSELAAILAQQNKLLEALVNRPPPSIAEQLKELAALRELFAPPPPPPAFDLPKLMELVTGVFKLRDELGGADGGDSNPLGVFARALAPALTKIADRALEQAPPPAPTGPAAPATDASAPSAQGDSMGASNVMLKAYVSQLVDLAERGTAPAAAAQRVAQTLGGFPQPMYDAVIDWLDDADVVEKLTAIEPKAAPYAQWLEQTVDALLELVTETEEPPAPATPANGTQSAAQL